MIICVCHRVSDRDIAREAAHGCATFDELQARTALGTGCGACREVAAVLFAAPPQTPAQSGHGHSARAALPATAARAVRETERHALACGH
ncbi:MAG: (2Fe-2S)-binding protein [Rubrivivax sp.]|nr:(2Fe-2S)-binding protein [Rubrivivax sp.]